MQAGGKSISFMRFVAYLLCTAAGYAAGHYLPESAASPYVPLLVSYHLLLAYLVMQVLVTKDQKLGLSMPLPMAMISHLAFVGGMIGMVLGRQHVPLFGLLQYIVPGLAPFEVRWVFEGSKPRHVSVEPAHTPASTEDEYADFLVYMKQGHRKFQRAGGGLNDEFAAWRHHREKKRAPLRSEITRA
jgi:hypothetical protein